jgi:C_GCAxxG_C_C family probable redox protein
MRFLNGNASLNEMKRLNRRRFIERLAATTVAAAFLGSCVRKDDPSGSRTIRESAPPAQERSSFQTELEKNRKLPRELVLQLLDQKVDQYMQLSHHCAQSSFMALKEQFGLDGGEVVKALTPLTGIAERGETCGAVTGPLMAMGLIFGRGEQRLNDWDTYRASLIPSGRFCERFEQIYGSTMCQEIQKGEFGRCYQLTDPDELREFQEADATGHCSAVVRKAVRIAAEIILEEA